MGFDHQRRRSILEQSWFQLRLDQCRWRLDDSVGSKLEITIQQRRIGHRLDLSVLADQPFLACFDNASSPALGNPSSIFSDITYDGFGPVPGYPFAKFAWQLSGNDVYLNFTAVPEPTTFGGSALLLILYASRRKRRRRKATSASSIQTSSAALCDR